MKCIWDVSAIKDVYSLIYAMFFGHISVIWYISSYIFSNGKHIFIYRRMKTYIYVCIIMYIHDISQIIYTHIVLHITFCMISAQSHMSYNLSLKEVLHFTAISWWH